MGSLRCNLFGHTTVKTGAEVLERTKEYSLKKGYCRRCGEYIRNVEVSVVACPYCDDYRKEVHPPDPDYEYILSLDLQEHIQSTHYDNPEKAADLREQVRASVSEFNRTGGFFYSPGGLSIKDDGVYAAYSEGVE